MPRWPPIAVGLLAVAALLGLAAEAQADHPAEEAFIAVVDGPRHDVAFDREGPLEPLFDAEGLAFANDTWAAGPAKTVPGHAALLTGSPQAIANDGSEEPEDPLLWEQLAEDRGWGPEEMRWLYQKDKLAVLGSEHVGGGHVEAGDEAMLDAARGNWSQPASRLVVASFARPDDTGHDGGWRAHEASLATIADGLAPLVEAALGSDTLVVVTADHARYCGEPDDHGRLGPFGPVDECDAHVPLWAGGWHVRGNTTVEACLTQADVGVLLADALGTSFPDAAGRFPAPLVNASASWSEEACPPARGGLPVDVPSWGPAASLAVLAAVALAVGGREL